MDTISRGAKPFNPQAMSRVWFGVAAVGAILTGLLVASRWDLVTASTTKILGLGVILGWLTLVVIYYAWAIQRYGQNFGLTDEEWKLLYPEIYTTSEEELRHYRTRRAALRQRQYAGADDESSDTPPSADAEVPVWLASAPTQNPYANDSFGLPPGTVRGTLALTAVVVFLVIEMVNLFDGSSESTHGQGITAFMMVLAFYFGAKAMDVFREPGGASGGTSEAAPASARGGAEVAAPVFKPAVPSSERPALPAPLRESRLAASVVAGAASPAQPARDVAAMTGGLTTADTLPKRVLALTASFETGRPFPDCFGVLAGNFDGNGISFGTLQWNLGAGTLQRLLLEMKQRFDAQLQGAMGTLYPPLCAMLEMKTTREQVAWAERIQRTRKTATGVLWVVEDAWRAAFNALGQTEGMMQLQVDAAADRYGRALGWCRDWSLTTERAVALMFDIGVQNGRLERGEVLAQVEADIAQLPTSLEPLDAEVEKLVIIATRRAGACAAAWRKDVLDRKLCIARGQGVVHSRRYDLQREFAVGLRPFAAAPQAPAGSTTLAMP